MFHSPAARAFGLSSSMMGIGSHRALPSRLATSVGDRRLVRIDVLLEERLEASEECLDLFAVLEVHRGSLRSGYQNTASARASFVRVSVR